MHKIAVFDIDGTIYREAMSFAVVEALITKFDFPEEEQLLAAARHTYKSRGSTEAYWVYNKTMLEICKRVIRRTTPLQLEETIADLLRHKQAYCYAYTLQLLQQYKAEGRVLIAISGSIANIVEPFARSIGFEYVVASGLAIEGGTFTGERVAETKHAKDQILRNLVVKHGLSLDDSIGVGDTHRDIAMLDVTEHAIAFNPNAALYAEAQKRGWDIVLERKNMIYELTPGDSGYVVRQARPIFDDNHQEYLQ